MVEELPLRVDSTESEEPLNVTPVDEEHVAASGISAVLLRARKQADELVKRARTQGGDLNEGLAAGQTAVSLTKDEASEGDK
jgi:hypothetical protein